MTDHGGFRAGFAKRFPLIEQILFKRQRRSWITLAIALSPFYIAVPLFALATSDELRLFNNSIVGGDFIVFWAAGKAAAAGAAATLYDAATLETFLQSLFPSNGSFNLYFQYPPTMFLAAAPFAILSYIPALLAWWAIGLFLFWKMLKSFTNDGGAVLIAMCSAAVFHGLMTGQTGLLTASLLAIAAAFPIRRPVLAGIAAGILTLKPQFGILIPFAYIAGGCWRAFGIAAISGIAIAALSILIFGAGLWPAFFEAVFVHSDRMGSAIFPYEKMITPFGALSLLGVQSAIAMPVQLIVTAMLFVFVTHIWRSTDAWDIRAMVLCSAAALATPYAFYYELPLLVPPLLLAAQRSLTDGWMTGERTALFALWVSPIAYQQIAATPYLPFGFILAATAFLICARRALRTLGSEQMKAFAL